MPPKLVDTVIGVAGRSGVTQTPEEAPKVKAYTTRVGHGPFPTELQNELQSLEAFGERLRLAFRTMKSCLSGLKRRLSERDIQVRH